MPINIQVFFFVFFSIISAARSFKDGGHHHHGHHHKGEHQVHDKLDENPHGKGKFCVDISKWSDVFYKINEKHVCKTEFKKRCVGRTEQVCGDVDEITCDIVPYTDCKMTSNYVNYNVTEEVIKTWPRYRCEDKEMVKYHTKKMPICKNETKLDCISDWKLDSSGKKYYSQGDCKEIVWENCQLKQVPAEYKVTKTVCLPDGDVCYKDCKPTEATRMVDHMECKAKFSSSCKVHTITKCAPVTWQDCWEEAISSCTIKRMRIPCQKKIHREQCLFHSEEEQYRHDHGKSISKRSVGDIKYGVSYENTRVDSNNATSTKRNPRRVYHEVNPTRRDIEEVRCADHDQPRLGYIKPSGKKLSSTSSYTSKSSSPYYPKKKLPYIAPIAQEYGSSIASITIHESGSVHSYGVPIANGGENNFRHNRIKKQSTSDDIPRSPENDWRPLPSNKSPNKNDQEVATSSTVIDTNEQ